MEASYYGNAKIVSLLLAVPGIKVNAKDQVIFICLAVTSLVTFSGHARTAAGMYCNDGQLVFSIHKY
jgi:hypothetical protein